MFKKRAQAALEFLTTYGWAFLVILIMIGALAYFGVLDPSRFLPDKCVASTGFSCVETRAAEIAGAGDIVSARITNGGAKIVTIDDAEFVAATADLTVSGLNPACADAEIYVDGAAVVAPVTWNPGQELTLAVHCSGAAGDAGQRVNAQLTMDYTEAGSTLGTKPMDITIGARVQ